jgi:uncharacterized protein DUF998
MSVSQAISVQRSSRTLIAALGRHNASGQYISERGRHGAAHPWIFVTFVGIWGLGFISLAVAVVPSLRTRPWPLAMPLMCVLAGVCAILVGPLHVDCSPTVSAVCKSREAAGLLSWHHYAHEWVSLAIKVSLLLTGFAFARCPLGVAEPARDSC